LAATPPWQASPSELNGLAVQFDEIGSATASVRPLVERLIPVEVSTWNVGLAAFEKWPAKSQRRPTSPEEEISPLLNAQRDGLRAGPDETNYLRTTSLPPAAVLPAMREQSAEWQDKKEGEQEDVPAAGDKHHSGEQQSPQGKPHPRYRSSVYGSRLPAFASPRLIM
jgi:hypothetical protein